MNLALLQMNLSSDDITNPPALLLPWKKPIVTLPTDLFQFSTVYAYACSLDFPLNWL